ncbi:MAG: hypothetical protein OEY94_02560 [Alphaproteobacteria bacterium]|nr:hypothetical protein [Alphaproteobacteria bacterium]
MTGIKDALQEIFSLNRPNMLLLKKTLADGGVKQSTIDTIISEIGERCKDQKFDYQMISDILAQTNLSGGLADIVIHQQEKFPDFGLICCP